jgi:hypothetical protein
MIRRACRWGLALAAAIVVAGCAREPARPAPAETTPAAEPYTPGLGDIMSLQQMRHVKLWFAGEAGNWDLASYELDELEEGFDDAVKFHPTHKDSPVAIKDVIPQLTPTPIADLRKAVAARDQTAFRQAFDELTAVCNGCHEATKFGFNRVQRPATNPYPNQVFEPPRR